MPIRDIPAPSSENIKAVQYDDDTLTLYVIFQRGDATYTYSGVPQQVAEGFTTSGMRANAFFNQSILNQYPAQRMS